MKQQKTKTGKEKRESKKKIKKLIIRLLSQKGAIHDLSIHTQIVMSLTREEMGALHRYYDMISFIAGIQTYDDILFILAKDKSKLSKKTFKRILSIRNKIAREHRNKRKKYEELFKTKK